MNDGDEGAGPGAYYRSDAPMDEATWLASRDPIAMLVFLNVAPKEPKSILPVLAYLERIWDLDAPGPMTRWAEQARLVVDGKGQPDRFAACDEAAGHHLASCGAYNLREGVSPAACEALDALFFYALAEEDRWDPVGDSEEFAFQADLVREIFGNPFRSPTTEPGREGAARHLAPGTAGGGHAARDRTESM